MFNSDVILKAWKEHLSGKGLDKSSLDNLNVSILESHLNFKLLKTKIDIYIFRG